MTPHERADALFTLESSAKANYHDVMLGGHLRLTTVYANNNDPTPRDTAERRRQAFVAVVAGAIEEAVEEAVAAAVGDATGCITGGRP